MRATGPVSPVRHQQSTPLACSARDSYPQGLLPWSSLLPLFLRPTLPVGVLLGPRPFSVSSTGGLALRRTHERLEARWQDTHLGELGAASDMLSLTQSPSVSSSRETRERAPECLSFLPLVLIREELGLGHASLRSPLGRPLSTWDSLGPRVQGRQDPCPLPCRPCWIITS